MSVSGSLSNPFHGSIMEDPWKAATVDVPSIHGPIFQQCCQAVEAVRSNGTSAGLVIHGQAGSGKTHLLSRLRSALAQDEPGLEVKAPYQVFVSVRLATSPRYIWRHIRQRFVDDLSRKMPDGLSQLEHVLGIRLALRDGGEGDLAGWWDYMRQEHSDRLEELWENLLEDEEIGGYALPKVLEHLIERRYRREARSWLRGDSLPEPALQQLGLPGSEAEFDEPSAPEQEAREVVISLCRLAGASIPIVFCFDQVEALQRSPGDEDGLWQFGGMASELHDGTSNCVLISCIQSGYLENLKQAVRGFALDRIQSYATLTLQPLKFAEAVELVAARLEASRELTSSRQDQSERLQPLCEEDIHQAMGSAGCTPRELIAFCAVRFAERQGHTISGPDITGEFLPKVWQEQLETSLKANTPEQTEHILADGLPALLDTTAPNWNVQEEEQLRDVDFVLTAPQQEARVGVSFCTQQNMTALAYRLKRLCRQPQTNDLHKLVLIRDGRTPISQTARKTRDYLKELETDDAVLYRPSAETMAALDALRKLLADADSGDLATAGTTVEAETVQEWLRQHPGESLQEFTEVLIGYPQPTGFGDEEPCHGEDLDRLIELLGDRHVIALDEAAEEMNTPAQELEAVVRQNPHQVGYLQGSPGVIFEQVSAAVTHNS